jgi:23S rRNA (guanosine2251-2'-O)-methyltransferase
MARQFPSNRSFRSKRKHNDEQSSEHWLFGLHAVRDALMNPLRKKYKLIVTPNAALKLKDAIEFSKVTPETADPRKFHAPLAKESVHQGVALHTKPLEWGTVQEFCSPTKTDAKPIVLLLDRVSDPHNVGAILRSAHAFGVRAVIAPKRHAAPETGALAKAASGALEQQPYILVNNLADAMEELKQMGYKIYGLDADAASQLDECSFQEPTAFVMGAEGPGLREKTKDTCDSLVKISTDNSFSSLNVSNAAAISLHTAYIKLKI